MTVVRHEECKIDFCFVTARELKDGQEIECPFCNTKGIYKAVTMNEGVLI